MIRLRQLLEGRAIDVLLLVGIAVTIWRFVAAPAKPPAVPIARLVRGSTLVAPVASWPSSEQNVVVAIQTFCPGCNQSVNFYRDISRALRQSSVPFVVLAQEDEAVVKSWLDKNQIDFSRIVSVPRLADVGVVVTPTIMRVTGMGQVVDIASGTLSPAEEQQLVSRTKGVGSPLQRLTYAPFVHEVDLKQVNSVFLDVRDREAFAEGHRNGAINIPHDEVEARALIELSLVRPIVVDCLNAKFTRCEIAGEALIRQGADVSILVPVARQ